MYSEVFGQHNAVTAKNGTFLFEAALLFEFPKIVAPIAVIYC
jgi:hypothetical protein